MTLAACNLRGRAVVIDFVNNFLKYFFAAVTRYKKG
jgi:hypothetical protein